MDWLDEKRHDSNMLSVLQKRETGLSSPAKLYDVVKANRNFVQRLRLDRRLEVHRGCVNTICWNESGTSVLSGSDDQHLVVSDPYTGQIRASIRSGHHSNIFCAKFLPSCQDQEIVSCSGAGSIYYTQVEREDLYGKCLFDCHTGTTYELVVVPNEARTFLTCGEDGTVRWYDLRIKTSCSKERCKEDVLINCRSAVTSISVDPILPYQLATACADGSVRVFDRRMLGTRLSGTYSSRMMTGLVSRFMAPMENQAHRITSLNYSPYSHYVLVSYSAENVYLFNTQIEETKEFSKSETEAEGKSCVNGDEASATVGADSGSQPPTKRLRLRGDWSDTGPNARPERERAEDTEGLPQVNLMQRMSDMLTRWLDGTMRRRGEDQPGRSTSPVGGAQEGDDRPDPPQGAGADAGGSGQDPAEQREGGGEEDRSTSGNREQPVVARTDVGFDVDQRGDVLEQEGETRRGALDTVVEGEEGGSQVDLTVPAPSKEGSQSCLGGGGSSNTRDSQQETAQARTDSGQAEKLPSGRKSEASVVREHRVTGDDSQGSSEVRRGFSDTSLPPGACVQCPPRSQSEQCVGGTPGQAQEEGGTMSSPFSDILGQERPVEGKSVDLPLHSVSSSIGQNSVELGKSGPSSSHHLTATVPPDCPTASGVAIVPEILPDSVPLQDSRAQEESGVDPPQGSGPQRPVGERAEGSEGGEGRGRPGHPQAGGQGSVFTAVTASQGSHMPGQGSQPSGQGSQPSGQGSQPSGQGSQPSGQGSQLSGQGSQLSGQGSQPSGQGSHMSGQGSHMSGQGSHMSGQGSHMFGQGSQSESGPGTSVTPMTRLEPVISLHYSAEGTTASTIQVAYASFNIMDPHPHPVPPSQPLPPQGSAVPQPQPHSMPSTSTTPTTSTTIPASSTDSAQNRPVSVCRPHSVPLTAGDTASVSPSQPVSATVAYPGPSQSSSGLDTAPGVCVSSEPVVPPVFSPSGGSLAVEGGSVPAGSVVSSAGPQTADSPQPCASGQGPVSSDVSLPSVSGTAALTQSVPRPPGDEDVNRGATCQTDHPTVQQDQVTASDEAQPGSDPNQRPPPPSEASADTAQEQLPSASSEASHRDTTAATTEGSGAGRQRRVGHSGPPTGDFQLVLNEENEDESDDEDDSREGIRSRSVPFWSYGASSNDERHYAAMCMQSMYRRRMEEREKQAMASVFQPQPLRMYSGHRNSRTMIKESNFWGDHVVMSGSDCGRIFMWDRDSTQLIMLLEADRHVVNCLQPHPFDPILASSGIDYDVKIWSPLESEPSFDSEMAEEVMRRNQIMLEETRDTITVPAAFMLRVLASLNQIRAGRAGAGAGRQQDDSPADSD